MKNKRNIKNLTVKAQINNRRSYPIYSLLLLTVGLLLSVALIDYHPAQNPWLTTNARGAIKGTTQNLVGSFGVTIAFWTNYLFGIVGWLLPIFSLWTSYLLMFRKAAIFGYWRYLAMATTLIAFCGLLDIIQNNIPVPARLLNPNYYPYGTGGIIGHLLFSRFLENTLGVFGSSLILSITYLTALLLSLTRALSPGEAFDTLIHKIFPFLAKTPSSVFAKLKYALLAIRTNKTASKFEDIKEEMENKKSLVEQFPSKAPLSNKSNKILKQDPQRELPLNGNLNTNKSLGGLKIIASERIEKSVTLLPQKRGNYIFPSHNLLQPAPEEESISPAEHQLIVDGLIRTLAEFSVTVTASEVHAGPVVTRYEVIPAPGVRVEKISSLDKNIALALKAHSVRILAPVPGKGTVGIEIPNHKPSPVCLRDIIESTSWSHSDAEIPIVLGKEVTGKPLVYDLTKMPHLLIAGSTGSGKTVCINTIITSLLYHASPDDLRFIMVDPKIVEMQLYNDLPHMLIPVVTNPKKVPGALKWLIKEMENRYQIFATAGVRNIAGFNAKILNDRTEKEKAKELDAVLSPEERAAINNIEVPRDPHLAMPKSKLPYIVCIIDELADLMIVAPADIETCIARLAQLARAAGIHLIIATQRPSVNVITGVIKANLPCRIAFKVASKIDSRTILDGGGADQLIGRGDMLFIPPGTSHQVRAQGAYASDAEINDVIEALKVNGPPDYADDVQREIESTDDDGSSQSEDEGSWDDDLVPAAINVLRSSKRASTSMLQRRLKIGYNRAARIMELLEDEGIVGPENGQNPREILKDLDMAS